MAENRMKTLTRRGPGKPFQPGRSGNPGGRPRESLHVRDLARQRTEQAILTLETIMLRGRTDAARVRAAEALLNRGWGIPTHYVEADVRMEKPDGVLVIGGDEQSYIAALRKVAGCTSSRGAHLPQT